MPGTVQVSVLEFMGLESSSPPSQTSIKVSMGKREYQTSDKGDFSFPLMTLRDNLIVRLQDAEGNEISHTGVETRTVIEKGIWDDIFPLEGGGHVHMKLQFVLSEEDRQRVRDTRESALRKKYEEFLNSGPRSPPHATTVSRNVASSFQSNQKVSDSEKSLLQSEVVSTVFKNEKSGSHDTGGPHVIKNHSNTIDIKTLELSKESCGSLVAKNETGKSHDDVPESQTPPDKTPSSVRNMISAFESSLKQDLRPKTKPPPITFQSSKTGTEVPSHLNEVKKRCSIEPARSIPGRVRNPFLTGEEQLTQKREEKIGFVRSSKDTGKFKEVDVGEQIMSADDLMRSSTGETASVSGRMLNKHIDTHLQSNNSFTRRQHSGDSLSIIGNGKETRSKGHQVANNKGVSRDYCYFSEYSGAWIFPDGGNRLCITTAGKQIMNLSGGFHAKVENKIGKMSSITRGNVKESTVLVGTNVETGQGEETSQRQRKPEVEESDETSVGPVGKVMRIAIMVGFATLVLFTRKRNPGS